MWIKSQNPELCSYEAKQIFIQWVKQKHLQVNNLGLSELTASDKLTGEK